MTDWIDDGDDSTDTETESDSPVGRDSDQTEVSDLSFDLDRLAFHPDRRSELVSPSPHALVPLTDDGYVGGQPLVCWQTHRWDWERGEPCPECGSTTILETCVVKTPVTHDSEPDEPPVDAAGVKREQAGQDERERLHNQAAGGSAGDPAVGGTNDSEPADPIDNPQYDNSDPLEYGYPDAYECADCGLLIQSPVSLDVHEWRTNVDIVPDHPLRTKQ